MPYPSVLLHDHLDGGMRPQTVLDLAEEHGYQDLPSDTSQGLAAWFDQSRSGSLEKYLEAFTHTIGVMQEPEAIERVAYEAAIDLSADGVVYAEIRLCPALHTVSGTTPHRVVEAASSGLRSGAEETGLQWAIIIDALRNRRDSFERPGLLQRPGISESWVSTWRVRRRDSPRVITSPHSGWPALRGFVSQSTPGSMPVAMESPTSPPQWMSAAPSDWDMGSS